MQQLKRDEPSTAASRRAVAAALLRLTLAALAATAPVRVPAQEPPQAQANTSPDASAVSNTLMPFQATYRWFWHGVEVALSSVTLEHRQDDIWVYSSSTRPRGLGVLYPMRPNLQSILRVTPAGVQPLSFKATGSGAAHDANVQFDWTAGRATGIYEGAKVDLPLKPGIQDDLSVQIAMLDQLLQGKTPDTALEINKNSVREYDYARAGEETLSTELGRIPTIIYEAHHPGSPRTTSFWCAPSLGFLPVQVEQKHLKAVEWTMKLRSYHPG